MGIGAGGIGDLFGGDNDVPDALDKFGFTGFLRVLPVSDLIKSSLHREQRGLSVKFLKLQFGHLVDFIIVSVSTLIQILDKPFLS
jgi:hypothetical protein